MSCLAGIAVERWRFNPRHKCAQQPPERLVVDVAGDASNLAAVVHHHESWCVAHRRNEPDAECRRRIHVDATQWKHLGLVGLAITGADIAMPHQTQPSRSKIRSSAASDVTGQSSAATTASRRKGN